MVGVADRKHRIGIRPLISYRNSFLLNPVDAMEHNPTAAISPDPLSRFCPLSRRPRPGTLGDSRCKLSPRPERRRKGGEDELASDLSENLTREVMLDLAGGRYFELGQGYYGGGHVLDLVEYGGLSWRRSRGPSTPSGLTRPVEAQRVRLHAARGGPNLLRPSGTRHPRSYAGPSISCPGSPYGFRLPACSRARRGRATGRSIPSPRSRSGRR